MVIEVNDVLGIAQFITSRLSEDQAICYLHAIPDLSLDDWQSGKDVLPGTDTVKRLKKESIIRDIVQIFINNPPPDTTYLVHNLAILPGLSPENLAHTFASVDCILKISSRIAEHKASKQVEHSSECLHRDTAYTSNVTTGETTAHEACTSTTLAPAPGWAVVQNKLPYKPREELKQQQGSTKKPTSNSNKKVWVHGTSSITDNNKRPQLTSICLCVRAGPDDTKESVTGHLTRWNIFRSMIVDPVSATDYKTTFRVNLTMSTVHADKWKDVKSWPTSMSASLWRGNPTKDLKPLPNREYSKRIYIGGISETKTMDDISNNMKEVYKEEIEKNIVKSIETLSNMNAAPHSAGKSVCVIVTSHPGQSLSDLGLKADHYPRSIRRTVRWWRGPPPYPDDHEMVQPVKSHLGW